MPNEPQPQGACELQGHQIEAPGLPTLVLPVNARRWVLADNTFWHTRWDSSTSTTSTSTVRMSKGDPVTYEEPTPEHKQKFNEIKTLFEADLIGSFERTHHHSIRWKGFSSEGALDGVDLSLPSEERTRALCQEVNYLVAHSMHRHSKSLVNAFEHVALRVIQEIMKNQYSPSGPTLGSHKGELPFQTRLPLPYTLVAPESCGAPAYVVYKVGGDPVDYQFFNEPPK
jgi:hypothetical protein